MILDVIEMLDFFGVPLTLNVFGKKKYRSLLGSFISICSIIFFIFAFQQKFRDFVNDKSIDVKQNTVQEDSPSEIIINNRDLMFAMRFEIWQNNILQNDISTIPFSFQISAVSQTIKDIDSKLQKIVKIQSIPVEQCTKSHFTNQKNSISEYIDNYFSDIKVESYFCPQIDISFNLKGNQSSLQYDYIKIEIISCQGKSNCWSQKQIDDYLATNIFFKAQIIFNTYIPNYGDPNYLKPFIYSKKFYRIIPSTFYLFVYLGKMKPIVEFFFAENQINSDESWYWFSEKKEEKVIMYSEEEYRENGIVSSSSSISYGEFLFQRSSYTYNTSRDYEKLDSILSYMGGFIQIVLVTAQIGMEFYNTQNLKLKFANQLYSFEKHKELSEEDKDINKFSSRQNFLENVFIKFQKIPKKLSLSFSYFLYRLSCQKLLASKRNQLLFEAMKQVDNDLNMFEILVRLHEFDKLKQIILSEDQKKVLEYSEKPQINMETIQKNKIIQDFQKNQKIRKKIEEEKKRKEQILVQKQISLNFFSKSINPQKHNEKFPTLKNRIQHEQYFLEQNSQNKVKIASIPQIGAEYNWERVQIISRLLMEENNVRINTISEFTERIPSQINQKSKEKIMQYMNSSKNEGNVFQQQSKRNTFSQLNSQKIISFDPLKQQESQLFQKIKKLQKQEVEPEKLCENRCSNLSIIQKNKSITHCNDDSDSDEDLTLLQKFLEAKKKQNFQGKLMQLIQEMRPSTFYSLRTDYSQFSSFYELFDICEKRIFLKKNIPYYKLTKKIIGLLRKDLLDAFSLAKLIKSKEEIEKEEKVEQIVVTFIRNIKRKIRTNSESQSQRQLDLRENADQITFPLQYLLDLQNMNSLKVKHIKNTSNINTNNFEEQQDTSIFKNSKENDKYFSILSPQRKSIKKNSKIHKRRPSSNLSQQDMRVPKFEKQIDRFQKNQTYENLISHSLNDDNTNEVQQMDLQPQQNKLVKSKKDFTFLSFNGGNQDENSIHISLASSVSIQHAQELPTWNFNNNIETQIEEQKSIFSRIN